MPETKEPKIESIEVDMSRAIHERHYSLLVVCEAIRDLASIVDQFCIEAK